MGPELMDQFRKQAERFGARLRQVDVTSVDLSRRPFKVNVGADEYTADALIIATGAEAKWLGVPGEKLLTGKGVSACATCDGFFFRGQHLAVIGGGDSAMEEATFLTRFADKVTVVHRRDELRASKIMQDRAMANPKIEFRWNSVVTELLGDQRLSGVVVQDVRTGEIETLALSGLFVAIGHRPNTDAFIGQLDMKENGYLVTAPGRSMTSVDGVFAAGDVQDDWYRQAVTAAGSGCMAAIDAERWLESQH
jgi:thioredoxin reductase (NADPH)